MPPRRILVYGVTGSGKTRLAEELARVTGLPWHSVADLTWRPRWTRVPEEEQRRAIEAICERDEWILDTANACWLDVPLRRVELIVALDYPRWLSFSRLLRRTAMSLVDRRPVCNGNRESLRMVFSPESPIRWHFTSFPRKRARIRAWKADPDGPPVVVFSRPQELSHWVRVHAAA